ncbi:hypothetical protein QQ045_011188 [Rhodiola kirilowii]
MLQKGSVLRDAEAASMSNSRDRLHRGIQKSATKASPGDFNLLLSSVAYVSPASGKLTVSSETSVVDSEALYGESGGERDNAIENLQVGDVKVHGNGFNDSVTFQGKNETVASEATGLE